MNERLEPELALAGAKTDPSCGPVHERFARVAAQHPDWPALRHGVETVSYAQLAQRAQAVAQALRCRHVGPGALVGMSLPRSVDQIACLFGVWIAGAAFVALDPELPAERLAGMVNDSGAMLVLGTLPPQALGGVPCVGVIELLGQPTVPGALPAFDPVAAAYLLFTSGSTGRPKAVLVEHGALARRLAGMQQTLALTPDDRFLQRTALSFDVAIEEIFWPLSQGASLVLADPARQLDAAYLVALMAQHEVTIADLVPSLLERLLAVRTLAQCTSLRYVLCGGESLPLALMRQCLQTLPQAALFNVYGPTEAVINALIWRAHLGHEHGAPPIGKPLPDTTAVVLDLDGQTPLPPGEIGELCLGGVLARGYVGQPQLTRQPFVPAPHQPDGRLYRTGDLVRQRDDGEFEFHGRIDHQVKLHGARIELGEIEAALLAHPEVRQACVLLQGHGSQAQLVAYLVADGGMSASSWRAHALHHLPRHMVPSRFVRLAAMPLTGTGKIDRHALALAAPEPTPEPTPETPNNEHGHVDEPQGIAAIVTALFARVLRRDQIGADDDFFDLGGDSLQATELLTELDELTGLDLTLETLYAQPTVARMAAYIESDRRAGSHFNLAREFAHPHRTAARPATPNLVLLRRGDAGSGRLFCIHPGDGGSSMYLPLVKLMRSTPSVYALTAWDLRHRHWPRGTVQDIAADYVTQVRTAQPQGPYHLFGWSSGAVIAYEMAQQIEQAGQVVAPVGMVDPFEAWETSRNHSAEPLPEATAPFSDDDWRMLLGMFVLDGCLRPDDHPFWNMPQAQRLEWVCDTAREQGRFPPSMSPDTFAYLCGVVRSHCMAYDRYRPTTGSFDITLFLPADREADNINATYWPALTRGRCEVIETGGDHLSMLRLPHVQTVAQTMDRLFGYS